MKSKVSTFLVLASLVFSCSLPQKEKPAHAITNKFSDTRIVELLQFADERKATEVLKHFTDSSATMRLEAVKAFASFRDSTYCNDLAKMLADTSAMVRREAAFALGQTRAMQAATFLTLAIGKEQDPEVRAAILEAVGKTGDIRTIKFFFEFDPLNDPERKGWAKGIFWFFERQNFSAELMDRLCEEINTADEDSRFALTAAMSRYRGEWLTTNSTYLVGWAKQERNPEMRSLLVHLLGRIPDDVAKSYLLDFARSENQDQRVRVSAIRSLGRMKTLTAEEILTVLRNTPGPLLNEVLEVMGKIEMEIEIGQQLQDSICNQGNKACAALLHFMETKNMEDGMLRSRNSPTTDDFEKAHFVRAMGAMKCTAEEFMKNVEPYLLHASSPVLRSAGADALAEWLTDGSADSKTISAWIISAFGKNDPVVMATLATTMRDETLKLKPALEQTQFLHEALNKLTLPKEIETYNELIKTINYMEDSKLEEKKLEFNHPIDWDFVKTIPVDQKVLVKTTKGDFTIELQVEDSPGSVSNFLKLATENFFDGKYWHRVVPNFVIQTGCPRGDGWGSTDYTIRSEFALHDYKTGAVGMASAGPDTESCQWFVTHSPTPHLEGRYTIFGYVVAGMDVVNRIDMGDKILDVKILP